MNTEENKKTNDELEANEFAFESNTFDAKPSVPYYETIESSRKVLFDKYKKSRKVSNIITLAILILAFVSMMLITTDNPTYNLIGWLLAGVAVVGLIVYYIANKNKFPDYTRKYIKELTLLLNKKAFEDEKFTDVKSNPEEKLNVDDVVGDGVYETIGHVASRNVVHGKFNDKEFVYAETALGKANATKKDGPIFVGKYFCIPNTIEVRGRIVINLKRKQEPVDLPSAIKNIDVLEENEDMVIYGIKDTDVKKTLGTLFLSKIKELTPTEHLMNTNIVIWAGRTAVYLSYDDSIMGLPFDKPFDKDAFEESSSQVLAAFNANEVLGK